jgi:hypothetical protein
VRLSHATLGAATAAGSGRSPANSNPSTATSATRVGTRLDDPDRFVISDPRVRHGGRVHDRRDRHGSGTLSQITPKVISQTSQLPTEGGNRPRWRQQQADLAAGMAQVLAHRLGVHADDSENYPLTWEMAAHR